MKEITIDPITRLEGHGSVSIFLNEQGEVENAYLKVPELRGFEAFCVGRPAELMPIITTRICGVCPVAHHYASVKALDSAFKVDPPSAAKKLRELQYMGYIIYDHTLHFYYLGGPDFIVGPDAPVGKRNILGVIEKAGLDVAKEVIKHRAYGQKITEIIGGKATHPVSGLPGGMSKPLSEESRAHPGDVQVVGGVRQVHPATVPSDRPGQPTVHGDDPERGLHHADLLHGYRRRPETCQFLRW